MNKLIITAFEAMIRSTKDMVFLKNKDLVYVAASEAFVEMVGKECKEEIIGHTDLEIFEDENLANRYVSDDRKLLEGGVDLVDYVEPITEREGRPRYGSTSKYILVDEKGEAIGLLGITKDITRYYVEKQHYQQELKHMFDLPENVYGATYIDIDDWRIIDQRRQLIQGATFLPGYTVEGVCEDALHSIVDEDSKVADFYRTFTKENIRKIYQEGKTRISFKYQRSLPDQSIRWVRNDIKLLTDAENGHLCVMLLAKDIEAQKQKEKDMLLAARMDKMTMLLNRETTMDAIRETLKKDSESVHALFMIDVDNFKMLNDTLGHQAGDEFLVTLAGEVKKCFRAYDIVGRIGGDEFFALMKNVSDTNSVEERAEKLLSVIQKICSGYQNISMSGSIGISLYPDFAGSLEELYAGADNALYQAKRNGKNQYVFYN